MSARDPERHIDMIKNDRRWPRWPMLPVKRYVAGEALPTLGIIHAEEPTIVRVTSMWATQESFDSAETHAYPTVEALVDAGWEVD